jgi:hypothetical protein
MRAVGDECSCFERSGDGRLQEVERPLRRPLLSNQPGREEKVRQKP